MQFNNRLKEPTAAPDNAPRIAFHALKEGDRYQHRPDGNISQVVRRDFDYAIISRHDGWLITCPKGGFGWDGLVIKVAPVRK